MSKWYEPKREDIDFSEDGKEVHMWLYQDDDGAVYCSVPTELLKEILKGACPDCGEVDCGFEGGVICPGPKKKEPPIKKTIQQSKKGWATDG